MHLLFLLLFLNFILQTLFVPEDNLAEKSSTVEETSSSPVINPPQPLNIKVHKYTFMYMYQCFAWHSDIYVHKLHSM